MTANNRVSVIMRKGLRHFGRMLRRVRLLFTSALIIASITPSWALAQSTDDTWTEPMNLSHSGVATKPAIVVDSQAVVHGVWRDDLENYVYSRFDGDQWSPPKITDLDLLFRLPLAIEPTSPLAIYTGPNPLFLAGPSQNIFAFWINPQGRLFTSNVESDNFANKGAWNSERLIAPGAVSFAAAVDARGEWHLAFFRTADDPANPPGIYYTHTKNEGKSWGVPVRLYESPYLRTLGAGEANLSLATADTEDALHVFIAWDNRPRKQVLLAQSGDGGESWDQPVLVAGPAPGSGLADPFNIQVGATQDSIVVVWQNGQATNGLLPSCSQVYQSSNDAGSTWSDPQPMTGNLLGCAQSYEFVPGLATSPGSPLYFMVTTKSQVFLTAWDGRQWSQLQAQPILSGFQEPEIYSEVIYGCHQASLYGERLYIIGCDQGEGGDVWVTSRDLESDLSSLNPPVWSRLLPVTSDTLEMESVELVTTDDELIHAFFSQHQDPAIYYTFWDGESWSRITPVLRLPDGEAAWPVIAAGPGNDLFLIARNNRGALYFSRATSGNAVTDSRWSTPSLLPIGQDGEVGSADVAWDADRTVYVAYSLPVNEGRGIYLIQSKDYGATWSEPLQVFDGAAASFDLVGAPTLLASESGFLHITWKQQSIQGDGNPQPLSLYYTRSEDGGQTFNDAELVIDEPVAWREIVADGKGNLHLLWQGQDSTTTVWDQVSWDGGDSWQFPQGLPDEGMTAAVVEDSVGRLHVVNAGLGFLDHWLWDGSRWQPEESLPWSIPSQQEGRVDLIAAAVNKQGKMVVVLAVQTGGAVERTLLYSTRTLELSPTRNDIQESSTQTQLTATLAPATVTPARTPTLTSTVDSQPTNSQIQSDRIETNDGTSPFIVALIPVTLLLLSVLGIMFRRANQANDR